MGTLTYNDTRLPEHCEHKLPTSCRLSSIPNCCACADERAHAPSYSTYIDGIGFVLRGNRWQRYCWYCKEFWEHRVEMSGLPPARTRIPENPDQKEFLERWYEFHRGYRIVMNSEGREERVAVLGEDFMNVSPGRLPRTLDELRDGRRAAEMQQQVQQLVADEGQENGPSLEEALDSMFRDAVNEEQVPPAAVDTSTSQQLQPQTMDREIDSQSIIPRVTPRLHGQAMNPPTSRNREYQMRRVAALRRELTRMRTGIERVISGLRDLGEDVPNDNESVEVINRLDAIIERPVREIPEDRNTGVTATPDRTLTDMQTRIDEARTQVNVARQARYQAASELETAESEFQSLLRRLQQMQREQRTMENYTRVFGTREEMVAQGENYQSPIGSMFTRAMERFRAAEDVRREERTLRQVLEDEARIDTNEAVARRLEELESRERDVWGVPRSQEDVGVSQYTISSGRMAAPSVAVPAPVQDAQHPPYDHTHSSRTEPDREVFIRDRAMRIAPADVTDVAHPDETETPPVLVNTNEETMLQEYYAMIRQQDWSQRPRSGNAGQQGDEANFPQNMLNAIVAARAAEATETQQQNEEGQYERDVNEAAPPQFSEEEWWNEDAELIIKTLTEDESLREEVGMSMRDASTLLAYFRDGIISERDRTTLDGLLRNETAIWRAGLPTEWLKRRSELVQAGVIVEPGFFVGDGGNGGSYDWAEHHNPYMRTEIMAQAFMMSGEVRRCASMLTPPARLQMLYRLQAGRRTNEDITILQEMTEDDRALSWALFVYPRHQLGEADQDVELVNQRRRQMARTGDHSRHELDTRRQETSTRAFALAAGRQAMQTGSEALMEQAALASANAAENNDQDAGTRAAYRRLHLNGFTRGAEQIRLYRQLGLSDSQNSSLTSSRSSSPEPLRGLDARDSGRPDPKPDDEMLVSMECKICYTQMAEIACLPCGHLVMCRWCSEQHAPCLSHDRTRPRRPVGCPVCRKSVRQKVRVFRV